MFLVIEESHTIFTRTYLSEKNKLFLIAMVLYKGSYPILR